MTPLAIWSDPAGSPSLYLKLGVSFVIGILAIVALMNAPTRLRRPIVVTTTFLAGLYWVLFYFWPEPQNRQPNDLPVGAVETVSFWLRDAQPVVGRFSNILTAFLLGLGLYSVLRIHLGRFVKQQKDWSFSLLLLVSMVVMMVFGYGDWYQRTFGENSAMLQDRANWGFFQFGRDLLFDGLLQEMEAAMFSLIAFFILSAAYRAFRIRSIEATILLATALIVMLSLMGAVQFLIDDTLIGSLTGKDRGHFLSDFTLNEIRVWLGTNLQTPGLRAIDFGIGIGALAMGLRLWLSLERGGVSTS
jgi:hypothetical protein